MDDLKELSSLCKLRAEQVRKFHKGEEMELDDQTFGQVLCPLLLNSPPGSHWGDAIMGCAISSTSTAGMQRPGQLLMRVRPRNYLVEEGVSSNLHMGYIVQPRLVQLWHEDFDKLCANTEI